MSFAVRAVPPSPRSDPDASAGDERRTAAVIIGLDGSDTAWHAFAWGCGEALRLGGRAIAVYVSSLASSTAGLCSAAAALGAGFCDYPAFEDCAKERAAQLRALAEERAAEQGVPLSFLHVEGDAAAQLLRIAERASADVIAVGRSTKAHHHLIGSLGRRLIAKAGTPIVVVVP